MMTRRAPLKRSPLKRKPRKAKPGKDDKAYLAWLHTQRCAVEEFSEELRGQPVIHRILSPALAQIEADHVGKRGMSQKCPDREAIPLCVFHHREGGTAHHRIGKNFEAFHGIKFSELIEIYNARYEAEGA